MTATSIAAASTTLLTRLRDRLDTTLGALVEPGSRCALLDYPSYANVGDSAIWMGTLAWLRDAGVEVSYAASVSTYSPRRLRARAGGATILLTGGGNLGDVWGYHQVFREQVLADFPAARVIQLPQSIHFRERAALDRAARAFGAHRDLVVLVRDEASMAVAESAFDCPLALCPDMAFALAPIEVRARPSHPLVYLARTDAESAGLDDAELRRAAEVFDWLEPAPPTAPFMWLVERSDRVNLRRVLDGAARRRVARGCARLARGEVVVTDRLHGHILCLLLGVPNVLMPDALGKLLHFHETWTRDSPITRSAASAAGALASARDLAGAAA